MSGRPNADATAEPVESRSTRLSVTVSVPFMKLWMLQWNLYVPAVAGAVNVAVLPRVDRHVEAARVVGGHGVLSTVLSFFTVTVDAGGDGSRVEREARSRS